MTKRSDGWYPSLSRKGKRLFVICLLTWTGLTALLLTLGGELGTTVDGVGPGPELFVLLGLNPGGEGSRFWLWVGRITLYISIAAIAGASIVNYRNGRTK